MSSQPKGSQQNDLKGKGRGGGAAPPSPGLNSASSNGKPQPQQAGRGVQSAAPPAAAAGRGRGRGAPPASSPPMKSPVSLPPHIGGGPSTPTPAPTPISLAGTPPPASPAPAANPSTPSTPATPSTPSGPATPITPTPAGPSTPTHTFAPSPISPLAAVPGPGMVPPHGGMMPTTHTPLAPPTNPFIPPRGPIQLSAMPFIPGGGVPPPMNIPPRTSSAPLHNSEPQGPRFIPDSAFARPFAPPMMGMMYMPPHMPPQMPPHMAMPMAPIMNFNIPPPGSLPTMPSATNVQPSVRKRIPIIDPNTGKEVDLSADTASSPATPSASVASPSPATPTPATAPTPTASTTTPATPPASTAAWGLKETSKPFISKPAAQTATPSTPSSSDSSDKPAETTPTKPAPEEAKDAKPEAEPTTPSTAAAIATPTKAEEPKDDKEATPAAEASTITPVETPKPDADESNKSKETSNAAADSTKEDNKDRPSATTPTASSNDDEDDWDKKEIRDIKGKSTLASSTSSLGSSSSSITSSPSLNSSMDRIPPGTRLYPKYPAHPSPLAWSKENPSGKRMYDKGFLMQFKEYFRDQPLQGRIDHPDLVPDPSAPVTPGGRRGSKTPTMQSQPGQNSLLKFPSPSQYAQKGHQVPGNFSLDGPSKGMLPTPMRAKPGAKDGNKFPGGRQPPRGLLATPPPPALPPVAPLQASENRWVRPEKSTDVTEQTLRKAKGILNKITLERFDSLSEQLMEIGLTTPEILKGVIYLVFEKALMEPKFSTMYATLCKKLSLKSSEFPGTENDKPITFKRVLLNKCQEEFESNRQKTRKKEVPTGLSPQEMAEWEDNEMRARKKMLGNIKFIGELFKEGMLTEKIMHTCIQSLLGEMTHPLEDDMEALSKLMTTIGNKIDHVKSRDWMNLYFERIKTLSTNQTLSSRIRFGLQDLMDLRAHKWVPRQDAGGPKTISQVHKDAADKEKEKDRERAMSSRAPIMPQVLMPGKRAPPPYQQQPSMNVPPTQPVQSDGWTQVGKDKLGPKRLSISDIKLAPGGAGGGGGMAKWGAGATGASTAKPAASSGSDKGYGYGGFQALNNLPAGGSKPAAPQQGGRAPGPAGAKAAASSAPPPTSSSPPPSQEKLEDETRMILQEYMVSLESEEAIACIKDLKSPDFHPDMTLIIITTTLESRDAVKEISKLPKLFKTILDAGVFKEEQLLKGLDKTIELLPDLVTDLPNAAKHFSVFLAQLLDANIIGWSTVLGSTSQSASTFPSVLQPLVGQGAPPGLAATILCEVLNSSENVEIEESELRQVLPKMFGKVSEEAMMKYIDEKELSFMLPTFTAQKHLEEMLKQDKPPVEMLGWVDDSMGDVPTDPAFARWLLRQILEKISAKKKDQIKQEDLKPYQPLLQKFIALDKEHNAIPIQLGCLYEIQHFSHSHKFKVVKQLFEIVHGLEIIGKDAYEMWQEDTKDPTPGKGEALVQADKWLATLSPPEEDSDEEAQQTQG